MRKCSRLQLSFEYKTTHGNAQHYSQKAAVDQHGTPSITNEGQWNAYHWHESDHHTDIYYNLPEKIKKIPAQRVLPKRSRASRTVL